MRRHVIFAAAALAAMGTGHFDAQPITRPDHAPDRRPLIVEPPSKGPGHLPHQGEREKARRRRKMAKQQARIGQN